LIYTVIKLSALQQVYRTQKRASKYIVNNVIQTTTTKGQISTVTENVQNVHP